MPKQARQFTIKEILTSRSISNQDDLRLELKKRGYRVTQATLSRDLHELGVGRISSGGIMKYALQPAGEVQVLRPVVPAQVTSIASNESLIVIRTLPGAASVVGEYLDALGSPEIIGTIAGDNTLLVIPHSQKKTKALIQYLRDTLISEDR